MLKVKLRTSRCAGPLIAHANPFDGELKDREDIRKLPAHHPRNVIRYFAKKTGLDNLSVHAGGKRPPITQQGGEHKMRFSLRILGTAGVLCFLACSAVGEEIAPQLSVLQLQISSLALPNGMASQSYRAMLSVTGGKRPYTWRVAAGSLPPGLTFNGSGAIRGTPCGDSGTWWATFQVTDARGRIAKRSLSISVGVAPLQITTPSLSNGIVGVPYSASLEATAGVPRCP